MRRIKTTVLPIALVAFAMTLFICPRASSGQEILKHPRVVALEDALKDSASEYVKARFPAIPFMVSVRVDPMRRDLSRGYKGSDDSQDLPYFSGDEDDQEIRDEWDNPQVPLNALINRVKRIQVRISVPAKLKETEVNELKDGIFTVLHLTPARDEVEIARRDWVTEDVPWLGIYAGVAVLIALLAGLLLINRSSANRIARALGEMKLNNGSSPISNAASTRSLGGADDKGQRPNQSQELKFNDPIKMKELATRHIEFLIGSKTFPNHQDLFLLDRLGKEHPEKLGAILAEFPAEMQRKLFSYSYAFHWIEALNDPGFLDFECLEVFQALTQNPREGDDLKWDHAVLAVWRLDQARVQFLKSLSRDEAFALLFHMPKAIAVSEARRCFPGAWATILDPEFQPQKLTPKKISEIQEAALRVLPLNDIEMVRRYRAERELLDYLKTVDPAEERDIYGAAAETSLIHKMRPPFFTLFDQHAEFLQWFVPAVTVEDWALALFNLPKAERAKVDVHLGEKQKYLLIEHFKKFDAKPPERAYIGKIREQVAALLRRMLDEKAHADKVNSEMDALTNGNGGNEDLGKAA